MKRFLKSQIAYDSVIPVGLLLVLVAGFDGLGVQISCNQQGQNCTPANLLAEWRANWAATLTLTVCWVLFMVSMLKLVTDILIAYSPSPLVGLWKVLVRNYRCLSHESETSQPTTTAKVIAAPAEVSLAEIDFNRGNLYYRGISKSLETQQLIFIWNAQVVFEKEHLQQRKFVFCTEPSEITDLANELVDGNLANTGMVTFQTSNRRTFGKGDFFDFSLNGEFTERKEISLYPIANTEITRTDKLTFSRFFENPTNNNTAKILGLFRKIEQL
jgi:hypothetical protein